MREAVSALAARKVGLLKSLNLDLLTLPLLLNIKQPLGEIHA